MEKVSEALRIILNARKRTLDKKCERISFLWVLNPDEKGTNVTNQVLSGKFQPPCEGELHFQMYGLYYSTIWANGHLRSLCSYYDKLYEDPSNRLWLEGIVKT
jgi:hypothetical protein